jgi:hypothetical protein
MHRAGLSRWLFAALIPAVLFVLPLSLAGCGGEDSTKTQVLTPEKFKETHKATMGEFKQSKKK